MWEFQRVNFEELPKKFRPGLRRLINYVYSVRQKKVPMATTVDICYSDSKPGYSWANIIELDDGWNLRISVNINHHTIKLKPENEYVRLETSEFDSLLEELTEFVHNQHSEADHYSEADHCSEAEQEVLEVEPVVKVEQTVAALCDQAVSPTARSRTVKVKIEIDLTGQGTVCNITSSRTTCLSEIHSLNSSSAFGAGDTPKPKKVKLEQGCSSIVKQEPASSSYHQTAPTCACGAHVVFCSAPGCCKAYCKPCDRELKKMKDTFSGFQTCSFFCTDRSKTAYCEEHRGLLSRCDACNELLCKKPRCNDCKQIICEHCLDEHELKVCSGRQQSRRAAVTVRC